MPGMKTLLASLFVTGCMVGSSTGNSNTNIIGGNDDAGDPAVGMLRLLLTNGETGVCTATAIAPTLAVTAGHCAEGIAYDISFEAQPNGRSSLGGDGYILVTQVIPDPAYDGNPVDGHDVSIVQLSTAAPATVALGAAPGVGASVRAVGYGMDVPGQDGTGVGVRRDINVTVDSVSTHEIVIGAAGQSTCHGDSGGPIFDASGALVATDSYGDANCNSGSHDMRIDDSLDFINQFLASTGSTGSGGGTTTTTTQCDVNDNGLEVKCTNGSCACLVDGFQVSTCTASDPSTACSTGNCCGF
jgi:V8-like Glu-specific endopeptidase